MYFTCRKIVIKQQPSKIGIVGGTICRSRQFESARTIKAGRTIWSYLHNPAPAPLPRYGFVPPTTPSYLHTPPPPPLPLRPTLVGETGGKYNTLVVYGKNQLNLLIFFFFYDFLNLIPT